MRRLRRLDGHSQGRRIDIQILGTAARDTSASTSQVDSGKRTRWTLDPVTRRDAPGFLREENVPQQAITMGVGTIMEDPYVIMAWRLRPIV